MRNRLKIMRVRPVLAVLTILMSGACASHDHKSVRTYDYREDDDAQRPSQSDPRVGRNEPTSESDGLAG